MTDPEWITRLHLLPDDARSRIRRYIEEGYGASLSTFYRAVLSNDLIGAVQGGDAENIAALAAFVEYPDRLRTRELLRQPRQGPGLARPVGRSGVAPAWPATASVSAATSSYHW